MPKLEYALFDYLTTNPGLFALVETRVFPAKIPELVDVFPAIAWNKISARRVRTYDRFEDFDAFGFHRIQFDAWAKTWEEAVQVGEALLAALSGYGGDMSGVLVTAHPINEFDDHDSGTKLFRRTLDFEVTYEDEVTTEGIDAVAMPSSVAGSGST